MKRALFSSVILAGLFAMGCASKSTTEDIEVAKVPAVVMAGFQKAYPNAKITEVEQETYTKSNLVHYEFEFTTADGKEKEAEFNALGQEIQEDK